MFACLGGLPLARKLAAMSSPLLKLKFENGPLDLFNMPLTIRATSVTGAAYTAEKRITVISQ